MEQPVSNNEDFIFNGMLTKDTAQDGVFTPEEAEQATNLILAFFEKNGWGYSGTMRRVG